jgi:hypothetical protein
MTKQKQKNDSFTSVVTNQINSEIPPEIINYEMTENEERSNRERHIQKLN